MPTLSVDTLLDFADPGLATTAPDAHSPLREVLAPLWQVAPLTPEAQFGRAIGAARAVALATTLKAHPDRRLAVAERRRRDLAEVFNNYDKRLPRAWVRWMSWAHWVYQSALPPDLPHLKDAIEALITVESQLHVSAGHPNRDHVVHPIADAELTVTLYDHARVRDATFDDADWAALELAIPAAVRLRPRRKVITRCALALAGLMHDVGYLRYIGAHERVELARLGVSAPASTIDLWAVAERLTDSYLDRILGEPGLVGDLYDHAWHEGWHGPLGAYVLAETAHTLRGEGRLSVELDAIFQIAAAAAALHELADGDEHPAASPTWLRDLRTRLAASALSWPGLFRVVDELQCWARPELLPTAELDTARVVLGAERCQWAPPAQVSIVQRPDSKRGKGELATLRRLAERDPELFDRLALSFASP